MLEEAIAALTKVMERNNALLEAALEIKSGSKTEAPAAEEKVPAKRGRKPKAAPVEADDEDADEAPAKPARKAKAKADDEVSVADVQKAAQALLADDPANKAFLRSITAELGIQKVSECEPEDREKVLVWIKAKAAGLKVRFDDDLDDIRADIEAAGDEEDLT